MKRMRKITALLLATVMVAGSGSIPSNLTSVKAAEAESSSADLSNYLTVYEDFDIEGYNYDLESNYFKDIAYVDKMPTLETRSTGNKWAKYVNNSGYGYWHTDVRPFDAPLSDYNGFAAYVKAETSVTFNFVMRSPQGLSRTISNSALDYTLITKDGKKSTGQNSGGIPIAAGFEGWVVIAKEEMTVAGGWDKNSPNILDGVDHDAFYQITNLNQIQAFVPELTNLNNGAVYIDDFAFVKDCDSFISYMAPPSVYDYLNVYEDFEGYGLGSSYNLDWTDNGYGPVSETAIKERNITGNKWIRFDGNNGAGHLYADYTYNPRTDFSGKNSSYDGMAMYVHTENAATLNIILRLINFEGISRSALNKELDYTLIAKDGTKTVAQGSEGMPIPAGFEGWVIFKKSEIPVANGWGKLGVFGEIDENHNGDLQYINRMAVEITNATAPVYVDDISFVTNTEDMINYLAPEQATAEDYLVVYEDFDSYDPGSNFELGNQVGNSKATAEIKKKKEKDRWLYLSGNSEAYHLYEGGNTNISLSTDEVKGFAYYVKTKSNATLNFLMSGKGYGLSNTMTNANLAYTLIAADGTISTGTNSGGIPVEAGYEGWVVIDKSEMTAANGYKKDPSDPASVDHDAFYGITNVCDVTGFAPEITNATDAVYVDNLSFVTNVEAFVNALKVDRPSQFVKYYETFNGYNVGKESYNWNSFDFGDTYKATTTIEQKGLTDKWLRLNGSNMSGYIYGRADDGSANRGWPYTGIQGKVSDYEGISLEVKTEFATTLNIRLGACVNGVNYIARTEANDNLSYQLIDTEGKVIDKKTSNGIALPAGFEGTVVFEKTQVTPHADYASVWEKLVGDNDNLSLITEFSPEVQTEGAIYLDNYAFVTDIDKYVASFKNQTYTYGTGDMNEDGIIDDYDVMLARKYLVANNTKMLNLDNNNWKGFEVTDKTVKNVSHNDGVAVYVKTNKVTYFNIAFQYKYNGGTVGLVTTGKEGVKEGETDDGSHAGVPITYTLVSSHGTKMEKTTTGFMEIPASFEGWVVFDTSNLHRNPGYGETTNLTQNIDVVFDSIIPIIQDPTGAVDFNLDSVSFVNGRDAFISALENDKSVGGYLQTIEDFESMSMGSYTLSGLDMWSDYTANAKIVKNGQFAQGVYDYNKDDKLGAADIVRLKKMAADMIEESGISLDSELVQDTVVWNTPGLAEDKDFQFDVEADSTWGSVTSDKELYLNSLKYHGVGETESLLPAKRAAEWGYSMSNLIGKTDGSETDIEFDYTTPVNNEAAVAQMKEFIQQVYNITDKDSWLSMNGYYPWYHYAAEFGASVVSTEIGEKLNNYQLHTAFVRGAGRQYHLPWGIDFSMWHDGKMYNPNNYEHWNTSNNEKTGHSLNLLERSLVAGYMSGANSVVPEAGGAMSLYGKDDDKDGYLDLTEYGKTVRKVYQFTEKIDRGTAFAPVGVVLDYYHGSYAGIKGNGWFSTDEQQYKFGESARKNPSNTFKYTKADQMTEKLAQLIWGTNAWVSGNKRAGYDEKEAMVNNSAYGDSFDILLDNASLATLKSYPVLVLSGNISLTADQIQMYKQYVNDGGTLILNKAYTSIFPAFDENMPYGDGEVIVYGDADYSLSGLDTILQEQIAKYQPVNVSATGNDIQYMTSMKDNKLYVTLINNAGVTKEGGKAVSVDSSKTSTVNVQYTGTYNVTSVADVYNNYSVNSSANAATVTVPAGGIAVLEFNLD